MQSSALTPAQREILRTLPGSIPVERLDRLWIFEPQLGKARETGLFVLSLHTDDELADEMRALVTVRYAHEQRKEKASLERFVSQEGWAPPERIERVIAGVLVRTGDTAADPREERLEIGEGWEDLLARLEEPG